MNECFKKRREKKKKLKDLQMEADVKWRRWQTMCEQRMEEKEDLSTWECK